MNQRQKTGLINKRVGAHLEHIIEMTCDYYRRKGIAHLEKTPEPLKPIRAMHNGQFIAVFTKTAQPDFKGTLKDGRSCCFEAKHSDSDRILQNRITPEQWESLDLHERLGAETFVVVGLGWGNFYKVPWGTWKGMKEFFGHKYMNEEELERFRIEYRDGILKML